MATAVLDVLHGCAFGGNARADAAARWLRRTRTLDSRAFSFVALRAAELRIDVGDLAGAQDELESLFSVAEPYGLVAEGRALSALLHAVEGRLNVATSQVAELLAHPDLPGVAYSIAQIATSLCGAQRGELSRARAQPLGFGAPLASRALRAANRALHSWVAGGSAGVSVDTETARHPFAGSVLVALGVLEVLDPGGGVIAVGGPAESALRRARDATRAQAHNAVLAAVRPCLEPERASVHLRTRIEAEVLAAVARLGQRDRPAAAAHVRTVMDLAGPDGLVAPILAFGPQLAEVIGQLATELGPHQAMALDLLDAFHRIQPSRFAEPLTDRERIVLRYLPTLMSNAEIAQSMHLSVNTVKTHLKALYRKLSVERRRDAVVRARQLELI